MRNIKINFDIDEKFFNCVQSNLLLFFYWSTISTVANQTTNVRKILTVNGYS